MSETMQCDWHLTADTIKAWVMARRWLMEPAKLQALLDTGATRLSGAETRRGEDTGGRPPVAPGYQSGAGEPRLLAAAQEETVYKLPEFLDSLWFKGIRVNAAGVATFPLHGTLYHRDCGLTWVMSAAYGGHITEKTLPLLEAVAARPEVKAVVLDIDSPGGEASGCSEFAATVARINVLKPVVAHVSGYMCSAAYFVGSSARVIVSAADGWIGSIGAVIHWLDEGRMLKDMGIDERVFISTQSPDKWPDPASESGAALFQAEVDACAEKFIETVAMYRGVSVEDVKQNYGQGRHMIAAEALSLGLIDAIGDQAELAARVASLLPAEPEAGGAGAAVTNTPVAAAEAPAPLRDALRRRLVAGRK